MTNTQASPSAGIWTPPPQTRRVERPRSPRVVGGVCSGLGRFTGVDPVVLRVVVAVLAITGAGLLLYAAAYLAMPVEGDEVSPAESLLGRGQSSANHALAATAAALGLVAFGWAALSRGTGVVLTVLAAVAMLLLLRRSGQPVPTATAAGTSPVDPPAGGEGLAYAPHGPYGPPSEGAGSYTAPGGAPPTEAADGDPATPSVPDPAATAPLWVPAPVGPVTTARVVRRRRSSGLGLAGLGLAVIAVGILSLIDQLGTAHPSASIFIAVPLAVIGVVVLISAIAGRAHGLIGLGALLTIALVAVQWIGPSNLGRAHLNVGDHSYRPAAAADVRSTYDLGVGDTRLDFSAVSFIPGVQTTLRAGIGDVRVVVPADTDVTVIENGGIGNVTAFGHRTTGVGHDARVHSDGVDGPGGGALTIRVDGGIGDVTVDRA